MNPNKKIVFVCNSLLEMVNCRGHIMQRMVELGYDIHLITPQDMPLEEAPLLSILTWHKWFLKPTGHNPFLEIISFFHLLKLLIMIKPQLSFSYTVKANLYCAVIGRLRGFKTCSLVTGLGRVFTLQRQTYKVAKKIALWGWQLSTQVWVMNQFDRRYLRFINRNLCLESLPGEGVDISIFSPSRESILQGTTQFLFLGRLLKAKGLEELFQAIKNLHHKGYSVHLTVAGGHDAYDEDKIDKNILDQGVKEGFMTYSGYVKDVRALIQKSHCLVLPSYREGLPRVLLEASAMQCPVITTNVPGCRDVVQDGINGFLCAPRNSESLEKALQKFMEVPQKEREKLGVNGRNIICQTFTTTHIQDFYLKALQKIFS